LASYRCLSIHSKMSHIPPILYLQEEDLKKMLACNVHLGSQNLDSGMIRYTHGRNEAGNHIIDLRKTWEKLVLAARVIAAIDNPKDICVVGSSASGTVPFAQRAVLKFGKHIGAMTFAGRFTPGTFTNQQQAHYVEPTVLVVSDPNKDHQPLVEASYMNIPVIAFCNTAHSLRNIDIAIPCNTDSHHSIALMYWLLAREVLRLLGKIPRDKEWIEMVDMFVYKDQEEQDKQEEVKKSQYQSWTGGDGDAEGLWGQSTDAAPESTFGDGGDEAWVGGWGGGQDQSGQEWPGSDAGNYLPQESRADWE